MSVCVFPRLKEDTRNSQRIRNDLDPCLLMLGLNYLGFRRTEVWIQKDISKTVDKPTLNKLVDLRLPFRRKKNK